MHYNPLRISIIHSNGEEVKVVSTFFDYVK